MASKKPKKPNSGGPTPPAGRGATDSSGRPRPASASNATKGGRSRAEVVAEFQRQQARSARRGRLLTASMVIVAVVIVVAVVVFISVNKKSDSGGPVTAASASTIAGVTGVPVAALNTVGAGSANNPPQPITGDPLTSGGKPQVLYIGAEYCPYCAAERWPMAVALSRFGTFKNLGQATSSEDDVPTLTFHGSTYTSKYLTFTGIEQVDGDHKALDPTPAYAQTLLDKYDKGGSIPFVDLGGKYVASGASFDPTMLVGKTHEAIATSFADPTSDIGKAVDGSANTLTSIICGLTNNQPAAVCTASGVVAAGSALTASS